jgi:hypothetical protein
MTQKLEKENQGNYKIKNNMKFLHFWKVKKWISRTRMQQQFLK